MEGPLVLLVKTIDEVREAVGAARASGKVVGLVPTMGALHAGHVALIERCRAEAGFVVVSIFVNPTQFGPREDYGRYPRTIEDDLARCAEGGADLVFAPDAAVMYPHGLASTFVEVPGLSEVLEGASRPGHFRGVATVVLKLFEIVGPDLALFGLKDYQQQLVIRRMVEDLALPVAIRTAETVREPDGLALSSRNRYLDPEQRQAATVLVRALRRAARGRRRGGAAGRSGSTNFARNDTIGGVGHARLRRGGRRRDPGTAGHPRAGPARGRPARRPRRRHPADR